MIPAAEITPLHGPRGPLWRVIKDAPRAQELEVWWTDNTYGTARLGTVNWYRNGEKVEPPAAFRTPSDPAATPVTTEAAQGSAPEVAQPQKDGLRRGYQVCKIQAGGLLYWVVDTGIDEGAFKGLPVEVAQDRSRARVFTDPLQLGRLSADGWALLREDEDTLGAYRAYRKDGDAWKWAAFSPNGIVAVPYFEESTPFTCRGFWNHLIGEGWTLIPTTVRAHRWRNGQRVWAAGRPEAPTSTPVLRDASEYAHTKEIEALRADGWMFDDRLGEYPADVRGFHAYRIDASGTPYWVNSPTMVPEATTYNKAHAVAIHDSPGVMQRLQETGWYFEPIKAVHPEDTLPAFRAFKVSPKGSPKGKQWARVASPDGSYTYIETRAKVFTDPREIETLRGHGWTLVTAKEVKETPRVIRLGSGSGWAARYSGRNGSSRGADW